MSATSFMPTILRVRPALRELCGDDLLALGLELVRAPLQEEQAEDVLLEVGGVHLAAQDVGGPEEVAFKLGEGQRHSRSSERDCEAGNCCEGAGNAGDQPGWKVSLVPAGGYSDTTVRRGDRPLCYWPRMKQTFVSVSEDCLIQIVLSGLEAYEVRHATAKSAGKHRLETYGLLWGNRSDLPDKRPYYSVQMMSVDTSARRTANDVTPSDAAINLKRDLITGHWPARQLLGDFHTHPWDPSEADWRTVQKQGLYEFSEQDRDRLTGADNPWLKRGYRVGLVLTITHLKGPSTIEPSRLPRDPSALQFALGEYRLWLKAFVARPTKTGLSVSTATDGSVWLDCPALLGLDGAYHDELRRQKYGS